MIRLDDQVVKPEIFTSLVGSMPWLQGGRPCDATPGGHFFFMSSRVWIQIASVGVFDRAEFPPKILRLMFFGPNFMAHRRVIVHKVVSCATSWTVMCRIACGLGGVYNLQPGFWADT